MRYTILQTMKAITTLDEKIRSFETAAMYFALRKISCSIAVKRQEGERGFVPSL